MTTISTAVPEKQHGSLFTLFFEQNVWVLILLNVFVIMVTMFIQENYIITKDMYYSSLGEQLTIQRIDEILAEQQGWKWLSYVTIPFSYLLQMAFIAICINVGFIIKDWKASFKSILKIIIQASIIHAIGRVLTTGVMLFMEFDSMSDLLYSNVFSLIYFFQGINLPSWLILPFSVINLFEIIFMIILAGGISLLQGGYWKEHVPLVLSTYGLGLMLYVFILVFIQINIM